MHSQVRRFCTIGFFLICASTLINAQPILKLVPPYYPGSEVTTYFDVFCHDTLVFNVTKSNVRVTDNGKPVTDFELRCPDLNVRCCGRIAIVIDRFALSAEDSLGFEKSKRIARAFVGRMDSICDEAMIISIGEGVRIDAPWTGDQARLRSTIDSLTTSLTSDILQGVTTAIDSIAKATNYNSSGILLLARGSSPIDPVQRDSMIVKALSHKQRIITVSCPLGQNEPDLWQLGIDTGGNYFGCPDDSLTGMMYRSICAFITTGGQYANCSISYPNICKDGKRHRIVATLDSLPGCPGSARDSTEYWAGSSGSHTYPVKVSDTTVSAANEVEISILLQKSLHNILEATSFSLQFDTSCVRFMELRTDSTLLDGIPIQTIELPTGIRITTTQGRMIDTSGVLMKLKFFIQDPSKERQCTLAIKEWTLELDCEQFRLLPGKITIQKNPTHIGKEVTPVQFQLGQNYPNPFSERTTITIPLLLEEGRGEVSFKVYDIFGREVLDLSDRIINNYSVGSFGQLTIHNYQLPSPGIYFYRLMTPHSIQTKAMIMLNQQMTND